MFGKRTAVILGAGASYCYEDGHGRLPLQKDIVGQLGGISVSSGNGAPYFAGPSGLVHSPGLARVLRKRYGLPEDSVPGANKLEFWDEIRQRGETLESVYADLTGSLAENERHVLEDFRAILRTSVKNPIPSRGAAHICRHHRRLVSGLEPGDYVIDFNWDSLMADALLYHCPFWYPRTGLGPLQLAAITSYRAKSFDLPSFVQLFHIHGSVLLFDLLEGTPGSKSTGQMLYVGPPGYTEGNSLQALGILTGEKGAKQVPEFDWVSINRGYIHVDGRWFRPFFIPPSMEKGEYKHGYHRMLRTVIHELLPTTQLYVVIGYSFPSADVAHLSSIFARDVFAHSAEVIVVDPATGDDAFRTRVREVFPRMAHYDFGSTDFKAYAGRFEEPNQRVR